MSKILGTLFKTKGASIIKEIGSAVDKLTINKEEREQFKLDAKRIIQEAIAEEGKNITERWKSDMGSDSWLSKNVRPLTLVFLIVTTIIIIFIDAGAVKFDVQDKWSDLLQVILLTVITAYFGGRSVEKVSNISKNKKDVKED